LFLFENKIKILIIKNGYENYFNISSFPFSNLLGYKNININITFIIFIVPLLIIIFFLEEYYFRFILEYRHNKYIEIFSKIKEIEYIDYLKENKNHWIKFSFLFALFHLNLNPIIIIYFYLLYMIFSIKVSVNLLFLIFYIILLGIFNFFI